MKRSMRFAALGLALLLLQGCGGKDEEELMETPTPPAPTESVYAATGRDNPNVAKNEYQPDAFVQVGGFTIYTGSDAASHIGVDVSAHQGEIDWEQVAASGVRYAMIRSGYRGYTAGSIYQDQYFEANIQGALDAGMRVGVYFFSQAVTPEEAQEEAQQVLEWIEGYDVTYPVVFDWEAITHDEARTDNVDAETVTECVKAFCTVVEDAGYIPMVYFNQNQGYEVMDLEQLTDYGFWLANYADVPSFQYAFEMWQYSCTGTVPGIEAAVDLNIGLVDYPLEESSTEDEIPEPEETENEKEADPDPETEAQPGQER